MEPKNIHKIFVYLMILLNTVHNNNLHNTAIRNTSLAHAYDFHWNRTTWNQTDSEMVLSTELALLLPTHEPNDDISESGSSSVVVLTRNLRHFDGDRHGRHKWKRNIVSSPTSALSFIFWRWDTPVQVFSLTEWWCDPYPVKSADRNYRRDKFTHLLLRT